MNSISTKSIEKLSDIDSLKRLLQSLAVLDLIMSPEWESRYYSFDSRWGEGETMGSMRNGCGDSFNALFDSNGCFFKGFAHEYPLSSWREGNLEKWKKILEKVPGEFTNAISEPAFDMDCISFSFWRTNSDESWHCAFFESAEMEDPDGSEFLLECLNGDPGVYQDFAEEYYEEDIPLSPIRYVYRHELITQEIIDLLNPEVKLADIQEELLKIGYPVEGKI
jgi:hypothetical protein